MGQLRVATEGIKIIEQSQLKLPFHIYDLLLYEIFKESKKLPFESVTGPRNAKTTNPSIFLNYEECIEISFDLIEKMTKFSFQKYERT